LYINCLDLEIGTAWETVCTIAILYSGPWLIIDYLNSMYITYSHIYSWWPE